MVGVVTVAAEGLIGFAAVVTLVALLLVLFVPLLLLEELYLNLNKFIYA